MSAESETGCQKYHLRPLSLEHIPTIAQWHERIDDLKLFDRRMPLPVGAETLEGEYRDCLASAEPRTSYGYVIVHPDGELVGLSIPSYHPMYLWICVQLVIQNARWY